MSQRRTILILLALLTPVVAACVALLGPPPGAGAGAMAPPSAARTPSTPDELTPQAALVGEELEILADAWDLGGGRYGHPFWDKAWQRWRGRELGSSAFREYVTGYRDILRPGCTLLEDQELETDSARAVQELLVEACRVRLDALEAQQERLELLIERDAATDPAQLEELDRTFAAALQESYRLTRQAMNDAQSELDALGGSRIAEDAFV